jgi:hypothetical protein
MSAYKQFLSSDIISTPFVVNKGFTLNDTVVTISNYGFYEINLTGSDKNDTANLIQDGDKLVLTPSGGLPIIDPLIVFRTTPTPGTTESALRSVASSNAEWFGDYVFPAIRANPFISTNFIISSGSGNPAFRIIFTTINPSVGIGGTFQVAYSGSVPPNPFNPFAFNTRNTSIVSSSSPGGFASSGIDRLLGKNITGSLINLGPTTGQIGTQYQSLVFHSAKHLYYSNFLTSSYGDSINRQYIIPGENEAGNVLVGAVHNPNFENYPQTSLTFPKIFPTGSDDLIGVISIPRKLFGEQILPESFRLTSGSITLYDDGEGNILDPQGDLVGNIIYSHGLVVLSVDSGSIGSTSVYDSSTYDSGVYGDDDGTSVLNFITSPVVTCSFSSSLTLFETQYKCTIAENEFNLSLNPSLSQIVNDDIIIYDYTTGSFFSPYITTVGLYNEAQELLAVGKLAQPVPTSTLTDMHVIINFDM